MLIPDFLHGLYRQALSNSRKKVTMLAHVGTWHEVTQSAMLDTTTQPGQIVLHGPSPLLGSSPHFHVYTLHMLIQEAWAKGRLTEETIDSVFEESLWSPWSLLGLLAQTNMIWIYPESRRKPLLMACLHFWEVLCVEGSRYTNGSNSGATLWELHSNLKFVLANFGVPTSILNAPLPNNDLRSVLSYVEHGSDNALSD